MSGDDNTLNDVGRLIGRIRAGDAAARRALLDRAFQRLQRLTAKILSASFPAVAAQHDLDSVVHETWLRLAQALDTTELQSAEHFFRLAAQKVRHVLLDMVARQRRLRSAEAAGLSGSALDAATAAGSHTYDSERLALWTELHEKVAALPDDERTVFEMHYYLDLPQAEIAEALQLHPRKVSRLWVSATEQLADVLEGLA